MKWSNDYRMRLMFIGFIVLFGFAVSDVKADFVFGTPTNLGPTVNSQYYDDCPEISADGLELYFHSMRPGGQGEGDIWVTTRTSKDEAWGEPVNLGPSVNSSSYEFDACISADGLSLYVNSMRTGGQGEDDLWVTTRATTSDPWGSAVNLGPTVNCPTWDYGPSISADGLSLYFVSNRPGSYGGIWVATRETTKDDWGEPVNLGPTINDAMYSQGPSISADELVLFFESIRPGSGVGSCDLWMSKRATIDDPWSEPMNLGSPVNTPGGEKNPCISADGRTLYFGHFDDVDGPWDIWQVSIDPIVDLNDDGIVDAADMCIMIDHWGMDNSLCDIGPMPWGDGVVDVEDLIVLTEHLFEELGLIAHWALDESEGTVAFDSTGNSESFVAGGAIWEPDGGHVDGAIRLDGVDDFIVTAPVLDPSEGPFSVLAWVQGGAPGQVIISELLGANWLMLDFEGKLMTEVRSSDLSESSLLSQTVITDGQWHRIGLVWDGSSRKLCVDDVIVAEDVLNGLEASYKGLYIGTGKERQVGTFWDGLIDDIRIYNRAVSP
jgi:hypothetical protein